MRRWGGNAPARPQRSRGESHRDERRDMDVATGPPVEHGWRNRAVPAGSQRVSAEFDAG